MCCFVAFSPSLSEVHTKKVRKVPPGLPSSVSDNMPFFDYFGGVVLLLFWVCAGEEKAPACLESLSWFCRRKNKQKKHEVVEELPGFVNLWRWRWRCCRSRAGHKQLPAFCCCSCFWGVNWKKSIVPNLQKCTGLNVVASFLNDWQHNADKSD